MSKFKSTIERYTCVINLYDIWDGDTLVVFMRWESVDERFNKFVTGPGVYDYDISMLTGGNIVYLVNVDDRASIATKFEQELTRFEKLYNSGKLNKVRDIWDRLIIEN